MWGWLSRYAGEIAIISGIVAVVAIACVVLASPLLGVAAPYLMVVPAVAALTSAVSGGAWLGYQEGHSDGRAAQQEEIEAARNEALRLEGEVAEMAGEAAVKVALVEVQGDRIDAVLELGHSISNRLIVQDERQSQDKIAMEGRLDDLESRITGNVVNELVARGFFANAGKQAAGVANMPPARGPQVRRSQRDVAANDAAASSPAQASLVP